MSYKSKSLEIQSRKTSQTISCASSLTCSMFSIRDDVSAQDSGLALHEMQGMKEENRELKLHIAKLQSELLAMLHTIEDQKVMIEKKEEDLHAFMNKSKMLEDHSSLLALRAHELAERKQLLENELEWRVEQLHDMKDNSTRERTRDAVQMKKMEDAMAVLKKMNDQLKEELKERDLHSQAKDIASAVICNCLQETYNEDLAQCIKTNNSLKEAISPLKSQVVDLETQLTESDYLLKETEAKCLLYEEKVSLLTLQLGEVETSTEMLKSELALKDKQIQSMEMKRTEEMKRLVDEANEKTMKEIIKNESLERVIARYRISQVELEEKIKEQQLILASKHDAFAKSSILKKASLLDFEQMNSKCEPIDLKDKYYTEGQELSRDYETLISEQDDNIHNSNDFKLKLKRSMEQCAELEMANKELEAKVEQLQLQLDERDEKIKQLNEQLTIFDEELLSKEITIRQLMMKKAKRRGLRRLICC